MRWPLPGHRPEAGRSERSGTRAVTLAVLFTYLLTFIPLKKGGRRGIHERYIISRATNYSTDTVVRRFLDEYSRTLGLPLD